jgi:hypothetical protein
MTISILAFLAKVLAAYVVVDAGSGVYHCITDRGWNIREQVASFQEHHRTNMRMSVDWRACYFGIPLALAGLLLLRPFPMFLGIFLCLVEVSHYYSHLPRNRVPALARWLQNTGIIMSYDHHQGHHQGEFDRNFCVLSGWNNWWLNKLLPLIPHRRSA